MARIFENPPVADVLAYANFLESVERLTKRVYRLRALGETARPDLDERLRSAARVLWHGLHFSEDRPPFTDQRFWQEISERFGTEVYFRSDELARNDPAAYLPGLALRLKLQAYNRLLSELEARGLQGEDLKAALVTELGRLIRDSSIFATKGDTRWSVKTCPGTGFAREQKSKFLAKLSEVALAPDPRIALVGGTLSGQYWRRLLTWPGQPEDHAGAGRVDERTHIGDLRLGPISAISPSAGPAE